MQKNSILVRSLVIALLSAFQIFFGQANIASSESIYTSKVHFSGKANFYSNSLHGKPTASGVPYDRTKLTAAHRTLPFGTKVKLVNRKTAQSCVVEINDRGPFTKDRVIDVSWEAAHQLGIINSKDRMLDGYVLPPASPASKSPKH
jgi:rare lipoprotein A